MSLWQDDFDPRPLWFPDTLGRIRYAACCAQMRADALDHGNSLQSGSGCGALRRFDVKSLARGAKSGVNVVDAEYGPWG